jgi:hypothetical protein
MNTIKGIILDKTINSIKLESMWIKFFKIELIKGIEKGNYVIVQYNDKEKDGKTYHNGSSIEKLKYEEPKAEPKLTYEIKLELTNTDKNCILMTAKDIYLSNMNRPELTLEKIALQLKELRLKL